MKDLRLLPTALALWGMTLFFLSTRSLALSLALIAISCLSLALKDRSHALVIASISTVGVVVAALRAWRSNSVVIPHKVIGKVITAPVRGERGVVLRVDIGHTVDRTNYVIPVWSDQESAAMVRRGEYVLLQGRSGDGKGIALNDEFFSANSLLVVRSAQGIDRWILGIHEDFSNSVFAIIAQPDVAALLPAMVLGDTSAQSPQLRQAFIDTGLAHLSAVSGANVAIVLAGVVIVMRACRWGPRVQIGAAVIALLLFVGVVGYEPSVLRALVTGIVGLAAMLSYTRAVPIHALCLAVIILILWDTNLAASFGFGLSVAATAGIIMLFPLLYHAIARKWLPDVLARAVAVTIAAELATLPIVALMAGQVSVVGVLANMAVVPVVAAITILGLSGVVLSAIPWSGVVPEWFVIVLCEPLVWWVKTVAIQGARLPWAALPVTADGVTLVGLLLLCAWIIALCLAHKFGAVALVFLSGLIFLSTNAS